MFPYTKQLIVLQWQNAGNNTVEVRKFQRRSSSMIYNFTKTTIPQQLLFPIYFHSGRV